MSLGFEEFKDSIQDKANRSSQVFPNTYPSLLKSIILGLEIFWWFKSSKKNADSWARRRILVVVRRDKKGADRERLEKRQTKKEEALWWGKEPKRESKGATKPYIDIKKPSCVCHALTMTSWIIRPDFSPFLISTIFANCLWSSFYRSQHVLFYHWLWAWLYDYPKEC